MSTVHLILAFVSIGYDTFPHTLCVMNTPVQLIDFSTSYTFSFPHTNRTYPLKLNNIHAVGPGWVELIAYTEPSNQFFLLVNVQAMSQSTRSQLAQAEAVVFNHFPTHNAGEYPAVGSTYRKRQPLNPSHVTLQVHRVAETANGRFPSTWSTTALSRQLVALGDTVTLCSSHSTVPFAVARTEYFHAIERNWAIIGCLVLGPRDYNDETKYLFLALRTDHVYFDDWLDRVYETARYILPAVIPPTLENPLRLTAYHANIGAERQATAMEK